MDLGCESDSEEFLLRRQRPDCAIGLVAALEGASFYSVLAFRGQECPRYDVAGVDGRECPSLQLLSRLSSDYCGVVGSFITTPHPELG
jgi:hypothetical protein